MRRARTGWLARSGLNGCLPWFPQGLPQAETPINHKIYAAVLLSFAIMGGFVPSTLAEPPQATTKAPSLYTQLGGYDALAAVTDDFITRLATDPSLAKFFTGLNDESKKRVRQHLIASCAMPLAARASTSARI